VRALFGLSPLLPQPASILGSLFFTGGRATSPRLRELALLLRAMRVLVASDSRQAHRNELGWQVGAAGRDDNELLAIEHVRHRRARRVARQRHFASKFTGGFVVGAELWVEDLEVRHPHGSGLGCGFALRAAGLALGGAFLRR
jgi:hypothetical protein